MELAVSSQASKVLPVGNPACLRRARMVASSRPAASSASSTRSSLGGVPALRAGGGQHLGRVRAQVGHPQPAGQAQHLLQRLPRRRRRLPAATDGHRRRRSRAVVAITGHLPHWGAEGGPAAGAGLQAVGLGGPGRRRAWVVGGVGGPGSSAGPRRRSGRPARRRRGPGRPRRGCAAWPATTASAILARIRAAPAAAASRSHSAAPGPMARNASSAALLRARGPVAGHRRREGWRSG